MAASSLLALLDDVASILDDVAVLSKVAAQKTTGVLGDDLALNAEQVSGVSADRELTVVYKVGKGSMINKLILVPGALLISYFAPFLILPLLLIGGSYLCFEGFEKIMEKYIHKNENSDKPVGPPLTEDQKIKGAIRTDFILSLEIIVIALGTIATAPFLTQLMVLSVIGFSITLGVYGLVALIVKIDDYGLWLQKSSKSFWVSLGNFILYLAPKFMKLLGYVGMVAMFLVGGGIISHAIPFIHHFSESLGGILPTLIDGLTGLVGGAIIFVIVHFIQKLKRPSQKENTI